MRKISEKELKKRGIKLKSDDLGRMAASKSSKVISDVSKAMQETVKTLDKISTATSIAMAKAMGQNSEIVKSITSKKWRVRITARDKDGLISEITIE